MEIKVSPSYIFKEADKNNGGTLELKELLDVLTKLSINVDPVTLNSIFKEIDVN